MLTSTDYDSGDGDAEHPASVLPWKREDSDLPLQAVAVEQREFPAWIRNPDPHHYSSPSATLLGRASQQRNTPSIIGYFQAGQHQSGLCATTS